MKKIKQDEQFVNTRPSTTLIQSKFVVNQSRLFQLARRTLEGKWLKPQSQAMYIHLFHQIVKHQKSNPSDLRTPKLQFSHKIFAQYFDMANIIKQFKCCIKSRLVHDELKPSLDCRIAGQIQEMSKVRKRADLRLKCSILQLKQEDPMKRVVTPNIGSTSNCRLRFNQQENNMHVQTRNVLGVIQKKYAYKCEDYGLQVGKDRPKGLLKHKKCHSNFNNYPHPAWNQKELNVKLSKHSSIHNAYYQIGLGPQHFTKHTSPQKSLEPSRKSSMKKQNLMKKKVSSQKILLKSEAKNVKK